MEWSMAIMKDWHRMNVMLGHPTWNDIVMSRARHPNIIMEAKEFDTKLSEARDLEGDHICTHPSKHKYPVTGAKEVVDHHKLTCWEEDENKEVGMEEVYDTDE